MLLSLQKKQQKKTKKKTNKQAIKQTNNNKTHKNSNNIVAHVYITDGDVIRQLR